MAPLVLRGLPRTIALLLPIPAVLLSLPSWIERISAARFPTHQSGIVVISGASTGIGRHAALTLDKSGYAVLAGVRKAADAAALREESSTLRPVILDVTDPKSIAAAAEAATALAREMGLPIIALINNAGVSGRAPLEVQDLGTLRAMYEVNVFGVVALTQALLPALRASQGRIVNVGSLAGLIATPGSGAYSGTKAALEATTDALRLELLPQGVSVSLVEPGYVRTAIAQKQMRGATTEQEAADRWGLAGALARIYGPMLATADARRQAVEAKADSPVVTSAAIAHAVASATPRTRYVVANVNGVPAWAFAWLVWLLPDRLQDWVVLRREPWVAVVRARAEELRAA